MSPPRRDVMPTLQPGPGPRGAFRHGRLPSMNHVALVGSILDGCADLPVAREVLTAALLTSEMSPKDLRDVGLDPKMVVLLSSIVTDRDRIARMCELGEAWAMGRRSRPPEGAWEPVLTGSPGSALPIGIRRGTAETLSSMIVAARESVRIVAPFVDEPGMRLLVGPIAAASTRGVSVLLVMPNRNEWSRAALRVLAASVTEDGDPSRVTVGAPDGAGPWPHLKVVAVDGVSAYIGSANMTGRALEGRNLELGVLVTGPHVVHLETVVDLTVANRIALVDVP